MYDNHIREEDLTTGFIPEGGESPDAEKVEQVPIFVMGAFESADGCVGNHPLFWADKQFFPLGLPLDQY